MSLHLGFRFSGRRNAPCQPSRAFRRLTTIPNSRRIMRIQSRFPSIPFADNYVSPAHNGIKPSRPSPYGKRHFDLEIRKMMKRITIAVHERTYHLARIWAAQHDTSVSAVVAYLLETLPGIPRAARAFPPAGYVPAPTPASLLPTPVTARPVASPEQKIGLLNCKTVRS